MVAATTGNEGAAPAPSVLWSDLAPDPLNEFARQALDVLWQDAHGNQRASAGYFEQGLWQVRQGLCEQIVLYFACRFWGLYDQAALRRIYARLIAGHEFVADALDYLESEKPWVAAWQMGVEKFETLRAADPELVPTFSRDAIEAWLDGRRRNPPPRRKPRKKVKPREKGKGPAALAGRQLLLFGL